MSPSQQQPALPSLAWPNLSLLLSLSLSSKPAAIALQSAQVQPQAARAKPSLPRRMLSGVGVLRQEEREDEEGEEMAELAPRRSGSSEVSRGSMESVEEPRE